MDNLRPGGALRWKVETIGWEGQRVVCGKPVPSMLYLLPMSIKDQWVGFCKQVLNVPIACWWYGPSKPTSLPSTYAWLCPPTASLVGSGEKLGTDLWIGQPACCGLCEEPLFSEAVALLNSIDDYVKGCYTWITWDTYGRGHTWTKRVACWSNFSPVGCTSIRIDVTLRYE
jgi:hypothetical protein